MAYHFQVARCQVQISLHTVDTVQEDKDTIGIFLTVSRVEGTAVGVPAPARVFREAYPGSSEGSGAIPNVPRNSDTGILEPLVIYPDFFAG